MWERATLKNFRLLSFLIISSGFILMGLIPFLSFIFLSFFLFKIIQQDPTYFGPDLLAFEILTANYLFLL